jgi:hypothetical protein
MVNKFPENLDLSGIFITPRFIDGYESPLSFYNTFPSRKGNFKGNK